MIPPGRLDRPVDHETDHVLGPANAEITLVEYGIVDDIGAIVVVAVLYSRGGYLAASAAMVVALALLSRSSVYMLPPYVLLGVALWAFVYVGGLLATLAGVDLHCSFRRGRQPTWPPR